MRRKEERTIIMWRMINYFKTAMAAEYLQPGEC